MSRRGDNIYLRKDGRWEGRYIKDRIDGKYATDMYLEHLLQRCMKNLQCFVMSTKQRYICQLTHLKP